MNHPSDRTPYLYPAIAFPLAGGFLPVSDSVVKSQRVAETTRFPLSSGTDATVYRNGTWYLLQSTAGVSIWQFGLTNETPVASAYIR